MPGLPRAGVNRSAVPSYPKVLALPARCVWQRSGPARLSRAGAEPSTAEGSRGDVASWRDHPRVAAAASPVPRRTSRKLGDKVRCCPSGEASFVEAATVWRNPEDGLTFARSPNIITSAVGWRIGLGRKPDSVHQCRSGGLDVIGIANEARSVIILNSWFPAGCVRPRR